MKIFTTVGTGPDRTWRSDEDRATGESVLLRAFAYELERAMNGRRMGVMEMQALFARDPALRRAWNRVHWENIPGRISLNALVGLARRLEGAEFRLSRRWSSKARRMRWGFELKGQI